MRTLALIFALVGLCVATGADAAWSSWFTRNAYQAEFDRQVASNYYPQKAEAQVMNGGVKFRGDFVPFRGGNFSFWATHGVSDSQFATKDSQYQSQGYRLVWHNRLLYGGRAYNQATWVR